MKYKPSSPLQVLGKRFLFYVENTDFSYKIQSNQDTLLLKNMRKSFSAAARKEVPPLCPQKEKPGPPPDVNRMFWKSSGTVKSP